MWKAAWLLNFASLSLPVLHAEKPFLIHAQGVRQPRGLDQNGVGVKVLENKDALNDVTEILFDLDEPIEAEEEEERKEKSLLNTFPFNQSEDHQRIHANIDTREGHHEHADHSGQHGHGHHGHEHHEAHDLEFTENTKVLVDWLQETVQNLQSEVRSLELAAERREQEMQQVMRQMAEFQGELLTRVHSGKKHHKREHVGSGKVRKEPHHLSKKYLRHWMSETGETQSKLSETVGTLEGRLTSVEERNCSCTGNS